MKKSIEDSVIRTSPPLKDKDRLRFFEYFNHVEVTGSPTYRIRLSVALSYRKKGYQYSNAYQLKTWDGRIRLLTYSKCIKFGKKKWNFPPGLLDRAVEFCKKNNIPYSYSNRYPAEFKDSKRIRAAKKKLDNRIIKNIVLHNYEVDAIRIALREGGGVINIPTAGGKSLIAAGIIKSINLPAIFFTHKKSYLSDMEKILKDQFNEGVVGRIGGGIANPRIMDVCSIQTISRNLDSLGLYLSSKKVIIVDESHSACSKSYFNTLRKCTYAPWKYGLTASPETSPIKMVGESYLGPIIYSIPPARLISQSYITPPKVIMVPIRKKILNHRLLYPEVYSGGITNNSYRNRQIADICVQLCKLKKTPIVILCLILKHHKLLAKVLDDRNVNYKMCDGSSKDTEEVFQEVREGKLDVCLFTGIFDESMNIPNLRSVILAGGGYSLKKTIQRIGRGMRIFKKKKYFVVIDFFDSTHTYLEDHSNRRLRSYKRLGYNVEIGDGIFGYMKEFDRQVTFT